MRFPTKIIPKQFSHVILRQEINSRKIFSCNWNVNSREINSKTKTYVCGNFWLECSCMLSFWWRGYLSRRFRRGVSYPFFLNIMWHRASVAEIPSCTKGITLQARMPGRRGGVSQPLSAKDKWIYKEYLLERCKGHAHRGHREKVPNVMSFWIFQGVFRVFSGCFQGVFRVFSLCPFRVCPSDPCKFVKIGDSIKFKGSCSGISGAQAHLRRSPSPDPKVAREVEFFKPRLLQCILRTVEQTQNPYGGICSCGGIAQIARTIRCH